jgi:DNA-binding LacI/PurR family transcriptional regulator
MWPPVRGVEIDGVARVAGQPLVRAETAKTVREAMRDIGYVYNRAAATLRGTSVGSSAL